MLVLYIDIQIKFNVCQNILHVKVHRCKNRTQVCTLMTWRVRIYLSVLFLKTITDNHDMYNRRRIKKQPSNQEERKWVSNQVGEALSRLMVTFRDTLVRSQILRRSASALPAYTRSRSRATSISSSSADNDFPEISLAERSQPQLVWHPSLKLTWTRMPNYVGQSLSSVKQSLQFS